MLAIYLFLPYFAQSISLKNELGTLYLTEGESYDLYLSDYFIGNNISYSITSTNSTKNLVTVKSACDFNLFAFSPFTNPEWNSTWSHTIPQRMILPINYQTQLIVWYNLDFLILHSFSFNSKSLSFLWAGSVDSLYQNPQIQSVVYFNQRKPFLLIQVKQEENIGNDIIQRNDFYYMSVADLANLKSPLWANFSEITYASKLVIGSGNFLKVFPIYSEFESSNILYIYNINNFFNPILSQTIIKYYDPQYPISELSVISILLASDARLYILDLNVGLIIYEKKMYFSEVSWLNLSYFDPFYSLWYINIEHLAILTNPGAIIVNIGWEGEPWIIGIAKSEGLLDWTQGYIQLSGYYYFIQSNNNVLSIIPNLKNPPNILYNIDIETIVGENFENNGLSGFWYDAVNNIYHYVRTDRDGLRIYELYIEEWSLEVFGNLTYFAEITGKDQLGSSVSSNLGVISIPSNSQQILPLDHYRKADIFPIDLVNLGILQNSFSLLQNSYFSGPNLSFKMDPPTSKYFSFKFSTPEKISFLQKISVPNSVTKVFIYKTNLLYFYPNEIDILSDTNENLWVLNISNPLIFSTSSEKFITFYSQPQDSTYLISTYDNIYFPVTISLIQQFKSDIQCIFLSESSWLLICSNSQQIDIYSESNDQYEFAKSLTGEMFLDGNTWILMDIDISDTDIGPCIYLIDKNDGFFVIDLNDILYDQPPFKYSYFFPNTQGIIKIIKLEDFVGLVNINGWTEIYSYPFSYFKRIFTNLNFSDFVDGFAMNNIICIQANNTIYIYDPNESLHNSLYSELTFSVSGITSHSIDPFWIANFYLNNNEKYLEIYQSACPDETLEQKCSLDMEIEIFINSTVNLTEIVYPENITITAYNEFSSLTENFPVNLFVDGEFLWMKDEEWKIKRNIPYNQRYEIDISHLFFGQLATMNMNINGNYIVNSTQSNLPCFIPERIAQIGYYEPANGTNFYSHVIIPHTNISIILSDFGFEIINAIGFTEKGILLNITDNEYHNLHCNLMDLFPHTKNNTILLITSCFYEVMETIFYENTTLNQPIFINALVLWELNYHSFEISQSKLFDISAQPSFLRVAALDDINFELIIITNSPEIGSQNSALLRFRGSWKEKIINFQQVEIISFFTLNLNNFAVFLADFKVKSSETVYWYVLDTNYGIRILETNKYNPSLIVGGISIERVASIGVCNDNLLLSKSYARILVYKINKFVDLEYISTYSSFAATPFSYNSFPGIIQCSDDGRYIANKLYNNFMDFLIGIWDTKAANSSNFISSIYMSPKSSIYYSHESLKFIDSNKISALGNQGEAYKSFEINEKKLIFPKMNKDEYNDLVEFWRNKEFSLYIVAANANNELSSQVVHFIREDDSSHEKSYWWVWIIVSIGIIGIVIGGYILLRKKLKANKRRSLELILMKKHDNYIGEDIEFEESKAKSVD